MLERRARATTAATGAPRVSAGSARCFRLLIRPARFPLSRLSSTKKPVTGASWASKSTLPCPRQQGQAHGKDQDQHNPQPEPRHGDAQERACHAKTVQEGILAGSRKD